MGYRKLTAIIRRSCLEEVEKELVRSGVGGLTVSVVKGFGEYANFFSRDWKVRHVKLEIFATEDRAQDFVAVIRRTAHTGLSGDGLIAVEPVTHLVRVRSGESMEAADLHERSGPDPAS